MIIYNYLRNTVYIFFQGDRVLGVTLLGGFAEECVVEQSVRNLPL